MRPPPARLQPLAPAAPAATAPRPRACDASLGCHCRCTCSSRVCRPPAAAALCHLVLLACPARKYPPVLFSAHVLQAAGFQQQPPWTRAWQGCRTCRRTSSSSSCRPLSRCKCGTGALLDRNRGAGVSGGGREDGRRVPGLRLDACCHSPAPPALLALCPSHAPSPSPIHHPHPLPPRVPRVACACTTA